MAMYNCIVCKTQFEGVAYNWQDLEREKRYTATPILPHYSGYDWVELKRRQSRAGPRTRAMIDGAISKKTGFQCAKCESWLCSAEENKYPKKSFWKGKHFLCANCMDELKFSKMVLPEDAFPPFESILQDQLEPGEKVENYIESGFGEAVVTNLRFLYYLRPLKWELLTDIVSVDMVFNPGGDIRFAPPQWQVDIGLCNKPKFGILVDWLVLPNFGQQAYELDPSFSWRKEVESIPRSICRGAGIPFSVPKKEEYEGYGKKPEGVLIGFYPKDDLAWPEFCASCCVPVLSEAASYDELLIEVPDGARHITPMPPLRFRIPYCSRCAATKLVGKKMYRSVRGFWYNGFTVYLDFLNKDFAEEFIRCNSNLES